MTIASGLWWRSSGHASSAKLSPSSITLVVGPAGWYLLLFAWFFMHYCFTLDSATLKLKAMEFLVPEAFFQRTLPPSLGSIAGTFPVPMSSASLLPEVQGCWFTGEVASVPICFLGNEAGIARLVCVGLRELAVIQCPASMDLSFGSMCANQCLCHLVFGKIRGQTYHWTAFKLKKTMVPLGQACELQVSSWLTWDGPGQALANHGRKMGQEEILGLCSSEKVCVFFQLLMFGWKNKGPRTHWKSHLSVVSPTSSGSAANSS